MPSSIIAVNLKACNHFRLYNGKAAETEMKTLSEQVRASSCAHYAQHVCAVAVGAAADGFTCVG